MCEIGLLCERIICQCVWCRGESNISDYGAQFGGAMFKS